MIRRRPVGVVGALVLLSCLSAVACDLIGVTTKRFVVRVDSISVRGAVTPADPLVARFWGSVGPDGCSQLERVETRRFTGGIELRFHGVRATGGGDCTMMPVALQHEEAIAPPLEDPFTIRVLQPGGGPPLEKQVRVR